MAKYIQREESKYWNNEFQNMPSLDFIRRHNHMTKQNYNRIDWNKVGDICNKYGFGFKIFKCTYSDDVKCVIYFKTDISAEYYNECRKAYNESMEMKERFWSLGDGYKDTYLKLHECIHELDEETELMFDYGWNGNCGIFGSDDVSRIGYSGGSGLSSWSFICDRYDPICYRTSCFFQKGIYIIVDTTYIKPEIQNSPLLADFEPKLLEITRSLLSDEYMANFENGKRQCDTDTDGYKALVIRYKDGNEYCCMIRFSRDWTGAYTIYHARPLCGESDWTIDWQNPIDDIKSALGSCAA